MNSRLTKLLGRLHKVFDKDPYAVVALQLDASAGAISWACADNVLTISGAVTLTVDLTQYTVAALAAYLGGVAGLRAATVEADVAGLSARILIDQEGGSSILNGDRVMGYTSPLWAYMDANAVEIDAAEAQINAALLELDVNTGDGSWLDELGSYYNVPRQPDELDAAYGPRIVAETLKPRGNNVAIEVAIEAVLGYGCTIDEYTDTSTGVARYGLFQATVPFDLENDSINDNTALLVFLGGIKGLVEGLRDAGTHFRSVALSGGFSEAAIATPAESYSPIYAKPAFTEAAGPQDDSVESLTLIDMHFLDGSWTLGPGILLCGRMIVQENLEGQVVSATPLENYTNPILGEDGFPMLDETGAVVQQDP